jgi:hypothetical protein
MASAVVAPKVHSGATRAAVIGLATLAGVVYLSDGL